MAFLLVSEQCCRVWTSSSLSCWHRSDLQLHRIARILSVTRHPAAVMNSLLLFRKVSTRSFAAVPPACPTVVHEVPVKGCLVRACHLTQAHIQTFLCIQNLSAKRNYPADKQSLLRRACVCTTTLHCLKPSKGASICTRCSCLTHGSLVTASESKRSKPS